MNEENANNTAQRPVTDFEISTVARDLRHYMKHAREAELKLQAMGATLTPKLERLGQVIPLEVHIKITREF